MTDASKYFSIKINKHIAKKLFKYILIFIFTVVLYFFITNMVFLTYTNVPIVPQKRSGLTIVLEKSFGDLLFECEHVLVNPVKLSFVQKYQIFNSKEHDLGYIFPKNKKEDCLLIQPRSEFPLIPFVSIWYTDTDPIKISISSIKILEDSYVFSRILEIAKKPCKFLPGLTEIAAYKNELESYYSKLQATGAEKDNYHDYVLRTIDDYLYAREALECDISSPKNEEVQLYFHDWKGAQTAVTVKLQRQGE